MIPKNCRTIDTGPDESRSDQSLGSSDPSTTWWQWILGHHARSNWDRCYIIQVGHRQLPVCARCLGLYPAMALGLGVGVITRLGVSAMALGLVVGIAFLDWALTRTGYRRGSNPGRTVTAAAAGFLLGWAVGSRLPASLSAEQWRVLVILGGASVMVELAALWMD